MRSTGNFGTGLIFWFREDSTFRGNNCLVTDAWAWILFEIPWASDGFFRFYGNEPLWWFISMNSVSRISRSRCWIDVVVAWDVLDVTSDALGILCEIWCCRCTAYSFNHLFKWRIEGFVCRQRRIQYSVLLNSVADHVQIVDISDFIYSEVFSSQFVRRKPELHRLQLLDDKR